MEWFVNIEWQMAEGLTCIDFLLLTNIRNKRVS